MFKKKPKPVEEKTVQVCLSCGDSNTRKYTDGDILFSDGATCKKCGKASRIEMIYGQVKGP